MSDSSEISVRLQLAISAAKEAGLHTLRYFCKPDLQVDVKGDTSPVTVADREAEQLLRERISGQFPTDGILGEEFPERPGTSGYRWILDPIDGTKSFIRGVPLYGTLVGVEHETRSVLGVIYIPALDEGVYASVGQGAWHHVRGGEPQRARVSSRDSLASSLFCTSEVFTFHKLNRAEIYEKLQSQVAVARSWGDCYGYLLVATGRAEVMVDPQMSVWDAAALQPILEEAGGTFTDWQGVPTIHSGEGIATNGRVLEPVLSITRLAERAGGK